MSLIFILNYILKEVSRILYFTFFFKHQRVVCLYNRCLMVVEFGSECYIFNGPVVYSKSSELNMLTGVAQFPFILSV